MVGRRRWLVPLLLVGMLAAPSTVIAVQLGARASSKRAQSNTAGRAQDYRFTARQNGKVSRLSLYLDRASTARALELGLYSGNAGSARARLARCTVRSPRRGAWNRCVIPEVALKKRSTYWLAVMQPKGSKGALRYRVKRGAGRSYASASAKLGVLPRSWRNGPRRGASRASIVADRPSSPASPSLAPFGLAPEPVPVPNGVAPGGPARIPQPVCSLQVSGVPAIEAALGNAANDGKTICVTAAGGDSTLHWSSKHSAMTTVAAIPTDGSVTLPGIDFSGASNITVQGFRLTGGTSLEDGASSIRLLANTFSDMSSDALDIHQTGGDIWFVGNLVQNIRYTGDAFTGYGIQTFGGPNNGLHINYNTFDMGGDSGDALQLGDVHDFEIVGNVIQNVRWAGTTGEDPHADALMLWADASRGLVKDNRITDSTDTLWSGSTSDVRLENNLIARMTGLCHDGGPTGSSDAGLVRYAWVRNTIYDCGDGWNDGGFGGGFGLRTQGPATAGASNTMSRNLLTSVDAGTMEQFAVSDHNLISNGDRPGTSDRDFTPRFADRTDYVPTNLPAGYDDVGYRPAPAGHTAVR